MIVVQSLNSTVPIQSEQYAVPQAQSLRMYDDTAYAYEALYTQQPNVRICVDFLAGNIAQLGLHLYRRLADNDRERLTDHPLIRLLNRPNPFTTRFRMIEALVADLGIWYNAYWMKLHKDGDLVLLRIPPILVSVYGGLVPTLYEVGSGMANPLRLEPSQLVHFRGYNPSSAVTGLSPLETLRRTLAEEQAMGTYREGFWKNSARMNGIIERPKDSVEWSRTARERFKAEFEALYSGAAGSGKTAILEEGMTWKPSSFSSKDSELTMSRLFTREECARAYNIPLPMVGILEHATFSNITEQHRNLYQDCLGPWMQRIEQDAELQLFDEFPDSDNLYLEFNIEEKLRGSFEQQAAGLQTSVGRPWMTPNEARGRVNLPKLDDPTADEIAPPANASGVVAGQSPADQAPADAAPPENIPPKEPSAKALGKKIRGLDPTLPTLRKKHAKKWETVLIRHVERQRSAMLSRVPKSLKAGIAVSEVWKDPERWNKELTDDMKKLGMASATVWGKWIADRLGQPFDPERMDHYLDVVAAYDAEGINDQIRSQVETALATDDPHQALSDMFESVLTVGAAVWATDSVTAAASFGAFEGAKQAGVRMKSWQVNSSNPRPEHSRMAGETVPMSENFSSGQRWPGDPVGGPENTAGCKCSIIFGEVEW